LGVPAPLADTPARTLATRRQNLDTEGMTTPMLDTALQPTTTSEHSGAISGKVPTLVLSVPPGLDAGYDRVLDLAPGSDRVIGRDGTADTTVPDPSMSRRHARVSHGPDGVWLADLASTNGSYLNGRRLLDRCRLVDGDQIRIGNTTGTFRDVRLAAADSTDQLDIGRDPSTPPDPTCRHDVISEDPGALCPRCSAGLQTDWYFCHQCGDQQQPIVWAQAVPGSANAEITRQQLIGPHGRIRSGQFRMVMRARHGGRSPAYNEGLAIPGLVFRLLVLIALIVAVVAAFVVLGLGVHDFLELRQQPVGRVGRSIGGHSQSVLPIKFHNRMR
jgi:hypothetical protein